MVISAQVLVAPAGSQCTSRPKPSIPAGSASCLRAAGCASCPLPFRPQNRTKSRRHTAAAQGMAVTPPFLRLRRTQVAAKAQAPPGCVLVLRKPAPFRPKGRVEPFALLVRNPTRRAALPPLLFRPPQAGLVLPSGRVECTKKQQDRPAMLVAKRSCVFFFAIQ